MKPASAPWPTASLLESAAFDDIDRHFARFMERLSGGANPELALAAALVSRSRGGGNICLDLRTVAASGFSQEAALDAIRLPEFEGWVTKLRAAPVVGQPEDFKPLVLDGSGRLYLHRYWEYESNLAKSIRHRAGMDVESISHDLLREGLERFFPTPAGSSDTNWQKVAAETAVRKRLCVISGGPGTGKTRTVAVVLALLLEQAGERPLRIAMAAPTGKAAARLQESIKTLKATLPCEEAVKARLPEETFTLHRLLGGVPGAARFRYHADNPLPFDVVVVDESSMVDLALMSKLFEAIPRAARVVLLGDKDQLASVEAGAVLGDVCAGVGQASSLPPGLPAPDSVSRTGSPVGRLEACPTKPPLPGCIVELKRNYRFGADNGILAFSRAINAGDAEDALDLLRAPSGSGDGIGAVALPGPGQLKERLRAKVLDGFGDVLRARDPLAALNALGRFRILCALRQGPCGVAALNRLAEEILAEALLIPAGERWYSGRPVMVTRNDYQLKLFNGDGGVILRDAATGEARAWFLGADNTLRSVPPVRLPEHETVFAMTVHKSQGSEFEKVLLVLPDRDSPVLTRELLYTGASRASRRVELWFNEPVLRAALARRVERASGLRDALWGRSMVSYDRAIPWTDP
jgi:exodeoxyribonuclease V alpha subunit